MFSILRKMFSGNNEELLNAIKAGAILVDVRTPREFAMGNVKGSVNIPLDKLNNHLADLKRKKQIVVYCQSGMRSMQAMSILKANNIENVVNGKTWQRVNEIINSK